MTGTVSGPSPLTIGIDFRPALSRVTGVGQYFLGLVDGLARNDATNRYLLFSSSLRERPRRRDRPNNFHIVDRRIPVRVLNTLWHRVGSPPLDLLVGENVDVAHSSTPLLVPSRRGRSVVTICDLFFLERPEATSREIRRHYSTLVRDHVDRADAVLVISETTARDVSEKLAVPRAKITVARPGVDPRFLNPSPTEEESSGDPVASDGHPYVLTVATLEPRKNIPSLLRAIAQLKSRGWKGRLLIAGGDGSDAHRIREAVQERGLTGSVQLLGYVPSESLPALYGSARALVIPSIWEGFGMPLLEAMAMHVPVICSDIPVHREVASDSAEYFDPTEPESIAAAIEAVWNDGPKCKELTRLGALRLSEFSWDLAATRVMAMYEGIA